MIGRLYKELWSRIGGRPWTYILRDAWAKLEIIWILALVAIGGTCAHYLGLKALLMGLGLIALGSIIGHVWWGNRYIPNQGTNKEGK